MTATNPAYTAEQLDTLHRYPGNARQGDQPTIRASLRAHGQYRPLVVQRSTRRVLVGNNTMDAMVAEGWATADVRWVDVDDDQARDIVLVDNRSSDLATYDDAALAELLAGYDAEQLPAVGYSDDDVSALLARVNDGAHFQPLGDDHEPERLDRKNVTNCPSCGHEFVPTTHKVSTVR